MKIYKLLKDLPDVKAGEIFKEVYGGIMPSKYVNYESNKYYSPRTVENNPGWFAPYLFTTEDGVKVFKGDWVYVVYPVSQEVEKARFTYFTSKDDSFKHFSTKKAAEQHLESLKPKFKVGDIVVGEIYDNKVIAQVLSINGKGFTHNKGITDATIYNTDLWKLADSEEIIKYYEELGWVKGVKLTQIGFVKNNISISTIFNYFKIVDNELLIYTQDKSVLPFNCFELSKEPNYPKSWKELVNQGGFNYCDAFLPTQYKFATETQEKSIKAFAQLTQLHKAIIEEYNRVNGVEWVADWNNQHTKKYVILRIENTCCILFHYTTYKPLPFPNKELAEFSLLHHKELWKQYYEL